MGLHRRELLQGMCAGAAALQVGMTVVASADQSTGGSSAPNIVMIVPDDLGWHDVGYHGSRIQTPNIDGLADGGVRLEQHYVNPTCSPTRVGLLTGRNPAHYGVHGPLGKNLPVSPEEMHLPLALQEMGYRTHIVGKWHLGDRPQCRPLNYGFDTSYGYLRGQIDPYTHRYKFGDYVTWHRNDEFIEERGHVTDLITEEAVRRIEKAGDQPFFLYLCHHTPHYPLNEPPAWIEPYEDVFDDVWRQHFAGAVTHMDHGIGQVLDALERTGQRENTLVVFVSDNGGQKSWGSPEGQYNGRYAAHTSLGNNTPLRGWKAQLYEGGIRVPTLANWPGKLPAGGTVEAPTRMTDWAPSFIRLAGAEPESEWQLEGRDLVPLMRGETEPSERSQFYWNHAGRARERMNGTKNYLDEPVED